MISASEVGTIPFPVCGECTGSPLCWLEIFGPVLAEAEELLLPPELLTEEACRCLYSSCKIVRNMKVRVHLQKVDFFFEAQKDFKNKIEPKDALLLNDHPLLGEENVIYWHTLSF